MHLDNGKRESTASSNLLHVFSIVQVEQKQALQVHCHMQACQKGQKARNKLSWLHVLSPSLSPSEAGDRHLHLNTGSAAICFKIQI